MILNDVIVSVMVLTIVGLRYHEYNYFLRVTGGYNLLHILDTDGRTSGCRKVQLTPAEMFCRNIIGFDGIGDQREVSLTRS